MLRIIALSLALSFFLLQIGCEQLPVDAALYSQQTNDLSRTDGTSFFQDDWGTVQKLELVRKAKRHTYYRVVTDKVFFDSINIEAFPGRQIAIGDQIFSNTGVNERKATVQYCRNDTCIGHSTCYSWMRCFEKYERKMIFSANF
jgi:hypothetical protein